MKQKSLSKAEISKIWKIADGDEKRFKRYLERRLHHEPIAYIRGSSTFFGLEFKVDRRAYAPNAETEKMIRLLLDDVKDGSIVLDVGTGCGSIAITIAKENPRVKVYGSDINPGALELARQNAESHCVSVDFHESNYVDCLDIEEPTHIIADLPYGITGLPHGNQEFLLTTNNVSELMHMPPNACFHPNGIVESYRNLIRSIIAKGWWPKLYFETGKVGKEDVARIIPKSICWDYLGFKEYSVTRIDFAGNQPKRGQIGNIWHSMEEVKEPENKEVEKMDTEKCKHEYEPLMSRERQVFLREWDIGVYETLLKIKETKEHNILGIKLIVHPGVHAGLWTDTKLLGTAIRNNIKSGDKVLDLGTSTGIQSLVALEKTDYVTAVDFNKKAVINARENFRKQGVEEKVRLIESNGFDSISGEKFDLIAINPPFRWFRPKDILDAASNDENYEFLNRFLGQAKDHLTEDGRILLVFANTADIGYLQYLFGIYRYSVKVVAEERPDEWRVYKVFELRDMQQKNEVQK